MDFGSFPVVGIEDVVLRLIDELGLSVFPSCARH